MLFHVERFQRLLLIALGACVVALYRAGEGLIRPYLRLDSVPGLLVLVFVWITVAVRLGIREREAELAHRELRAVWAGSAAAADFRMFLRRVAGSVCAAVLLLLPAIGIPDLMPRALSLLGSIVLAVAILDGGSHRWGVPDLFLALALSLYWCSEAAGWEPRDGPGEGLRMGAAKVLAAVAIRIALLPRSPVLPCPSGAASRGKA